ncbi:AraC family transcriptional regulator N-terminal domain-containing protein [Stigmatella sp. ncwal1]|uniref:AraC family transcriptional regulator N-terminal domain-containing protein n=1 Tax=Stigmatella ashevillensis TaxID=2995309 RepID=A0ABT5DKH0_9BACT|nr:AraC family transcriptional regulator N-terminal domain-containing protein [Stigmatella ashevillena]
MQPLPGLRLLLHHRPTAFEASLYEPVVCLILQGRKETTLGDRSLKRRTCRSCSTSNSVGTSRSPHPHGRAHSRSVDRERDPLPPADRAVRRDAAEPHPE